MVVVGWAAVAGLAAVVVVVLLVAVQGNGMLAKFQAVFGSVTLGLDVEKTRAVIGAVSVGGGLGESGAVKGPLSWLPSWKQTGGVLPDGALDPGQYSDCGETCVCMVVAGVHGVALHPGDVREYLHGVQGSGLTTPADLLKALAYYHVPAHVETPSASGAWLALARYFGGAQPVIMLGTWLNTSALHWEVMCGVQPGVLKARDPWVGSTVSIASLTFRTAYAGSLVVIDTTCKYDMSACLEPGT